MAEFVLLRYRVRERYLKVIAPVTDFFARLGIHPDVLTLTGLVLSLLAGIMYGTGSFFWAAWVLVLAGVCDSLDGQIARKTNRQSAFGAFFDSTLDRYGDLFPYTGLAYHFAGGRGFDSLHGRETWAEPSPWTVVLIILAIAGSFMVSYTRARAEGLGVECRDGLMQRPERMTLLILGSFLGSIPVIGTVLMKCTLLVLAVSSNITAISRMIHTKNQLLAKNRGR